ncbi:hypothetical protein [Flavobacterium phragmitis]|uniref:Uncharacterized protein n=1 Tax=Flavobacterium phragmitis TaxID=739143 RepID=A0A1I1K6E0_9FLAO|nr:hypothetical protein [Flavobacterium phragmitis]SFC56414.1 hypothetical protein SAMN05216297_101268 [Flavobacterium phragmitis]
MTAHVQHFHLYLSIMLVVTAALCILAVILKMRNKKGPKLLEREKYNSTMAEKMVEVKKTDSNIFNIWPYVSKLKSAKILSKKIKDQDLIYKIYRDPSEKFEHILLSTEDKNNFVSIIVNKKRRKTIGYSFLDSNEQYDLSKNIA